MRFIICGGRDYNNKEFLFSALDKLHSEIGIDCVIQGGQIKWDKENKIWIGADYFAKLWAYDRSINTEEYKAEWRIWGNAAGPKRNTQMLLYGSPDGVVAFPRANGDMGPGTLDMVRQAQALGLKVWFPVDNVGG